MRRFIQFIVALNVSLISFGVFGESEEGFPGREKFPDIPYIELIDFYAQRDSVIIVDARSKLEFETLRIKNAINIPIAGEFFENELYRLRLVTDKTIVFYCNGHRCYKSYQAVKRAKQANIGNVVAYDAGIFDWATRYPEESVLLGNSPINPKSLIAKSVFKSKLMDPDTFSQSIVDSLEHSVVIDVRDKFQRAAVGFYPGIERWAALDDRAKLFGYIQKAKQENKTLYIYDEVGKQVRWLQYALEKAGVKNYYFMEKGARAYYKMLIDLEWNR